MTIYVSRSWPTEQPSAPRDGDHPHAVGRGSGSFYIFPDEMWAAAKDMLKSLQAFDERSVGPGVEVKYEWRRGYPGLRSALEGAFCALDDKPEEIMPDFRLARGESRQVIDIPQADTASDLAA